MFGINFVGDGANLYDIENLYKTSEAAGFDLAADLSRGAKVALGNKEFLFCDCENGFTIKAGERALIPTGIRFAVPVGYEVEVRSRSGLSLNSGIIILNAPGTVDSDYSEEVGHIIINTSNTDYKVNHGDRLSQAVLKTVPRIVWEKMSNREYELFHMRKASNRTGGYGSTGV